MYSCTEATNNMEINAIYNQAVSAVEELLSENRTHFNPVKLLVIGCSSSEIAGGTIGHESTYEYGEAVSRAMLDMAKKHGFAPAFQCCEHLNRALVMERNDAEKYGYDIVCAVPRKKAGGSLATSAWKMMDSPVLVESIQADAGIDIGLTFIGMHFKPVAVPVRLKTDRIGCAIVTAARTRPKLIGGERACYTEE